MSIRRIAAKRARLLVVCGRCAKRTGGAPIAKPLRRALKPAGYDVVRAGCMGICPGKATVMRCLDNAGEWLIVRNGTAVEDVVAELTAPPVAFERPLLFRSVG